MPKLHPMPQIVRVFLLAALPWFVAEAAGGDFPHASPAAAAEQAHAEMVRRFVDKHGILLDFADLDGKVIYPTPEECRQGKPNALGWWSPIENGGMFNGMYMEAAVHRARRTRDAADVAFVHRLADGMLLLASLNDIPGFVGRGVAEDGISHYPMGSNDQTGPWLYGMWRYLDSGLATPERRARVTKKLTETAVAIERLGWKMPAEPPFGIRGTFASHSFENAPRLVFLCKLMHHLTQDAVWEKRYRELSAARGGEGNRSRLEICERGMIFEHGHKHSWTACSSVVALRALWELETDPTLKAAYARGLEASADLALESLPIAEQFDPADTSRFEPDWRKMNHLWKPQQTEHEAVALAQAQLREFGKLSPRRGRETNFIREPVFAAWIVTLAPDADRLRARRPALEKVLTHFDYTKLTYSQFFPIESVWERLLLLPNQDGKQ